MTSNHIPNASGIYKITCTVTKKFYIGSANNLYSRQYNHFNELRRNKHHNRHLQRAWNKHGEQAFTFEVLELVLLPDLLTAREQYWFDLLKPFGKRGYNLAPNAESRLGIKATPETIERLRLSHIGKRPTAEAIEKIRQSQLGREKTPEEIEKSRQARLGRKLSPEAIEKRTQSRLGWKQSPESIEKMRGRKLSSEHVEKIRQYQLGRKKTPEAIEKTRQANLGKPSPLRGVKRSPETIEKIRQARRTRKEAHSDE